MRRGAGILVAIGVVFLLDGASIHVKARIAQVLVRRAWRETLTGEKNVRPWPWADTFPVARLRMKRLGADYIVLSGASGRTLAFGPAHLNGTPLPGAGGNSVISAHRDTHFTILQEVRPDDEIEITRADGRSYSYRVRAAYVTHHRDTAVLASARHSRLTLITCYPFDAPVPGGPLRYVVEADLAGPAGQATSTF